MGTPLISKKLFNRIRRHLPVQKYRKRVSDRKVISGILWVIRTGSAWRQLPEFFGKWTTIYSRFKRWSKAGIFEKIFKIFAKRVNKQCHAMMDSTYVKAHRTASICACKDKDRKIGTSRGGKTTKIHILCNEAGIPFEYIITGGEVHDVKMALELLGKHPIKGLIADKAYGSKEVRDELERRNIEICIPPKSNSKCPWTYDEELYRKRHKVENIFAKLKDPKGIALRMCRCAHTFTSFVSLTLIRLYF